MNISGTSEWDERYNLWLGNRMNRTDSEGVKKKKKTWTWLSEFNTVNLIQNHITSDLQRILVLICANSLLYEERENRIPEKIYSSLWLIPGNSQMYSRRVDTVDLLLLVMTRAAFMGAGWNNGRTLMNGTWWLWSFQGMTNDYFWGERCANPSYMYLYPTNVDCKV